MRSKSYKKIAVEGPQSPLGSLDQAFENLDLPADLPEAPEEIRSSESTKALTGGRGRVILRRETARRGGRTVIVVDSFAEHVTQEFIESVAKRLRSACGCGGTVRHRAIELQGDQPKKVKMYLEHEGFTVCGVR